MEKVHLSIKVKRIHNLTSPSKGKNDRFMAVYLSMGNTYDQPKDIKDKVSHARVKTHSFQAFSMKTDSSFLVTSLLDLQETIKLHEKGY